MIITTAVYTAPARAQASCIEAHTSRIEKD